eukprot:scpid84975/ scgid30261/ 
MTTSSTNKLLLCTLCLLGHVAYIAGLACSVSDLQLPANAHVTHNDSHVPVMTTLNITCMRGYRSSAGALSAQCLLGPTWGPVKSSCLAIDCGPPAPAKNSHFTGKVFTYGSNVTLTCNEGYFTTGGDTILTCDDSVVLAPASTAVVSGGGGDSGGGIWKGNPISCQSNRTVASGNSEETKTNIFIAITVILTVTLVALLVMNVAMETKDPETNVLSHLYMVAEKAIGR